MLRKKITEERDRVCQERRVIILDSVTRKGLFEKLTFEFRLEEVKE